MEQSNPLRIITPHQQMTDPVCGMAVEPATAAGSHEHQGRTYYFCAVSCLEKFPAKPDTYLKRATVKDPICGMAVDPECAAGAHEHGGRTYYFCSPFCLEKFRANPDMYLKQVVAKDPVCGMDVEPGRAAGILYPFIGLLLSPFFAAAAMAFSSVSVITNALRLHRLRL